MRDDVSAPAGAALLDGIGDYVEIESILPYETLTSGRIEMDFTVSALDGEDSGRRIKDTSYQTLFSRDSSGFDGGGHITALVDGDGSLLVRHQSGSQSYYLQTEAGTITAGVAASIAYIFDPTEGLQLLVGVDGAAPSLVAANTDPATRGDPVGLIGNEEPWTLGASQVISGDDTADPLLNFFEGAIDRFEIFDGLAALNTAPVAADDSFETEEDQSVQGNVLVDNGAGADSDAEDDPLSVGLETDVSNGVLVLQSDGRFTYVPDDNFFGQDSFVYRVSDGNGGSDTATVTIDVTQAPPPASLLGQWLFNDENLPGFDGSANANTALLQRGAQVEMGAVQLDGVNDYVEIANIAPYLVKTAQIQITFTIDALDGTDSGTNVNDASWQALFSRDSRGFDNGDHLTALVDGDGSILIRHQSATESYLIETAAGTVTAGEAFTLVYQVSDVNGMTLFEKNGDDFVFLGFNEDPILNDDPVGLMNNNEPFTLGASQVRSANDSATLLRSYLDGEIDSFEIYNFDFV